MKSINEYIERQGLVKTPIFFFFFIFYCHFHNYLNETEQHSKWFLALTYLFNFHNCFNETKEKLNVFDTRTHLYAFAKNLFIKIKSHLLILCIIAFNHSGYYKQSNSLPDITGRKGADVKRECPFKLIWFSRGQCVKKASITSSCKP